MARDFFDELGETISRTTKDLGKRAGQVYEAQKIRNKLSSEEHMVEKLKGDIGKVIYHRYENGAELDEELKVFCEEIQQHMEIIAGYKDAAAEIKGRKICPSCGKSVERTVSFCPYCGAPCPTPDPAKAKEEAADSEKASEPEQETKAAAFDTAEEPLRPVGEAAEEASQSAGEAAEEEPKEENAEIPQPIDDSADGSAEETSEEG